MQKETLIYFLTLSFPVAAKLSLCKYCLGFYFSEQIKVKHANICRSYCHFSRSTTLV